MFAPTFPVRYLPVIGRIYRTPSRLGRESNGLLIKGSVMNARARQCLSAAETAELVRRPLPDAEAQDLARHLEQCSRCAAAVKRVLEGPSMATPSREDAPALPVSHLFSAPRQQGRTWSEDS